MNDIIFKTIYMDGTPMKRREENVHKQNSYDGITGIWYVIEVLQHRTNDREYRSGDVTELLTCPTVLVKYPGNFDSELKLNWIENEGDVQYRFRVNETLSPGKWESAGAQTGSLTQVESYTQFAGTVFVLKAVNDHMVLTFCSPNRQLYSLVMARNATLDGKELTSIKNQMKRTNLPVMHTKLLCRNAAATAVPRAVWLLAVAALCLSTTLHRTTVE